MFKKLGISALAALMTIGVFSLTEAEAAPNGDFNALNCRGGYCYNQNYSDNGDSNGSCSGGYCSRYGGGRGAGK